MDERKSTVSKTVMPVGQSTRELWATIVQPGRADVVDVIDILAAADERDCYAVSNLLYAWRTGQLA
jgi:hypothetical protein